MTFEECKHLLETVKERKWQIKRLRKEIQNIDENIEVLSLRSPMANSEVIRASGISRPVEKIVLRLEQRQQDFMELLSETMDLEDKLVAAVESLPEDEKEIIVEYYMGDTKSDMIEIANRIHYCDRTVYRKKKTAIRKIADTI